MRIQFTNTVKNNYLQAKSRNNNKVSFTSIDFSDINAMKHIEEHVKHIIDMKNAGVNLKKLESWVKNLKNLDENKLTKQKSKLENKVNGFYLFEKNRIKDKYRLYSINRVLEKGRR